MKIYALKQDIPAGIGQTDSRTEFFSDSYYPKAFQNGRILSYEEFPEETKEVVYREILSRPDVLKGLISMGFTDKDEQIQQYLLCTRAMLDSNPDIDENGVLQEPEYVPCPRRGGECDQEGIVCAALKLKNGQATPREAQILKKIGQELLDKEICGELNISQNTLRSHKDKLFYKTGTSKKEGLAIVAYQNNLLQKNSE